VRTCCSKGDVNAEVNGVPYSEKRDRLGTLSSGLAHLGPMQEARYLLSQSGIAPANASGQQPPDYFSSVSDAESLSHPIKGQIP
jgi:hypothetical protein